MQQIYLIISLPTGEQLAIQLWACLGVEIADHIENKFGYRQFAGSSLMNIFYSILFLSRFFLILSLDIASLQGPLCWKVKHMKICKDNAWWVRHCCNDGTTLLWPFLQRGESRTYLKKSWHFHFFLNFLFFIFFKLIYRLPLSSLRLKLPTLTSCSPNLNRCHPNDADRDLLWSIGQIRIRYQLGFWWNRILYPIYIYSWWISQIRIRYLQMLNRANQEGMANKCEMIAIKDAICGCFEPAD